MAQKPYLHGGCGRVILPAEKPPHYALIPDAVASYPLWVNADINEEPGVDCVVDLFEFPWPWPDNSFDGAVFGHFVEHLVLDFRQAPIRGWDIDVYQKRVAQLKKVQDVWWVMWAEIWRVCTPGSLIHVLAPYATSHGYLGDPSHRRPIVEQTFQHSMQPNPDAPFAYNTAGLHFEVKRFGYEVMPKYMGMMPIEGDTQEVIEAKNVAFDTILHTHLNVVNTLYCCLECVK